VRELEKSGIAIWTDRVDSLETFSDALRTLAPDVVLADAKPDKFDSQAALEILRSIRPTTPFIVVSDTLTGAQCVALVRAGAEDLVLSQNLSRLPAVVTEAIKLRRDVQKLTARQVEVLRMVAGGLRTREIADKLELSIKTVESHRGEIMKRLRLHDGVSLVRYAIRIGLVPLSLAIGLCAFVPT
jgi:DNA-binding NarL/FixJ family response regulator